ncbi:MAG: glucose 1-dehydrogenase [SAR324 cluster bacterium]|nr:glucose 1-dehydrogenase [SAR324 cluster bacterium]
MSLADKVTVVTGASRGIGKAISLAFAAEGAAVACVATSEENARGTVEEIMAAGGRALALGARVERSAEVLALFDRVRTELGGVDILINNAGVVGPVPVLEMSEEEWDRQLGVNAKGPFLCSQAAARMMQSQGREGCVINIGSIAGENAFPHRIGYCASKAALHHMTRVMALEWAPLGIRVNCIAPGYILPDIFKQLAAQGILDQSAMEKRIPQGRLGEVEDIAQAAIYLAGAQAKYVTGTVLTVDGGWDAYGYL